jgi:hypothetical protein
MRVQPGAPLAERIEEFAQQQARQEDELLNVQDDSDDEMEEGDNGPDYVPDEPNVFDPGFLEVRQRENAEEQAGTRAQQLDLLEAVADSRDERTHDKLKNGVRPGEFYELFSSLGK